MYSPSVTVKEIDNSANIHIGSFGSAAFVGYFNKGPINYPTFISSINEFKTVFGEGYSDYYQDWSQVYNYLNYSSGIWVSRTTGDTRSNATSGTPILIDNLEVWREIKDTLVTPLSIEFYAKTPGSWGNTLSIGIISVAEFNNNSHIGFNIYSKDAFTFFEEGSFGICIFENGILVETYYKDYDAINEINDESIRVYLNAALVTIGGFLSYGTVTSPTASTINGGLITAPVTESFGLGLISADIGGLAKFLAYDNTIINLSDGFDEPPSLNTVIDAHEIYHNTDSFELDVFIGRENNDAEAITLANTRKDCMVYIGLPKILPNNFVVPSRVTPTSETEILNYIGSLPRSQFVHYTANIKVQTNIYTEKNTLTNLAGDIAGVHIAASKSNPWGVGAGTNNGQIKNVTKMHRFLSQAQTSEYHKIGVNTTHKHELSTQFTFITEASSFDHVNVRNLFNHIEKASKHAMRYIIFNNNTEYLRNSIELALKNLVKLLKDQRGINDGLVRVITDDSQPDVITVEIIIKPKYAINTITIRVTNAGTNEFKSVVIG